MRAGASVRVEGARRRGCDRNQQRPLAGGARGGGGRGAMPTCTLVTTAQPNPARAKAVLEHGLTSVLSEGASVPREYVHIHAVFGAQGTFGAVSDTPVRTRGAVLTGRGAARRAAVFGGGGHFCACHCRHRRRCGMEQCMCLETRASTHCSHFRDP